MTVSGDEGLAHRSSGDTRHVVSLTPIKCREAAISHDSRLTAVAVRLRGGGKGASSTAHHSEQPMGLMADGEGEW